MNLQANQQNDHRGWENNPLFPGVSEVSEQFIKILLLFSSTWDVFPPCRKLGSLIEEMLKTKEGKNTLNNYLIWQVSHRQQATWYNFKPFPDHQELRHGVVLEVSWGGPSSSEGPPWYRGPRGEVASLCTTGKYELVWVNSHINLNGWIFIWNLIKGGELV